MPPGRVRRRLVSMFALAVVLLTPAGANAFDTGPHSDITRDALTAEGFSSTAVDVAVVNNWFVDLYSNSSKIPQSGHAKTSVEIVGSLFGPRENWPEAVLTAANRTHFDASIWDVSNVLQGRGASGTACSARRRSCCGASTRLGRREPRAPGAHDDRDGPALAAGLLLALELDREAGRHRRRRHRLVAADRRADADVVRRARRTTRDKLNVYIGESTGHKDRPHGAWNTDGNKTMEHGVNKDWPGRAAATPTRTRPRTSRRASGCARCGRRSATRRCGIAIAAVRRPARSGQLDHDLKGALRIGMMTGHWQGQGEPCDPSFSLNICGSRNGLGGDLIGARNVIRDYFEDREQTGFRAHVRGADPAARAAESRTATCCRSRRAATCRRRRASCSCGSRRCGASGCDALGDPTPADRADIFTRATIAGQRFQSGEINGRDSFRFPLPYAPFTFIKAIPNGVAYRRAGDDDDGRDPHELVGVLGHRRRRLPADQSRPGGSCSTSASTTTSSAATATRTASRSTPRRSRA